MPAGKKFQTPAGRRHLADLARLADQNPSSNQVFGELRRRSSRSGSGLVRGLEDNECRWRRECEQPDDGGPEDVLGNVGFIHGVIFLLGCVCV